MWAGGRVYFTVTVTNTGTVDDTYLLSWSDNENWGDNITLSENSLLIPAGENKQVILSVNVPDVEPGTVDNITVIAQSQENENVSDNNSCFVRVILVKVKVSIWPRYGSKEPGETLGYAVYVKNEGDLADNYTLTVRDNEGWALELSDSSLEDVKPGETRLVGLSVTVPKDALGSTDDSIQVVAISRRTAGLIRDDDNCIAHAAIVRRVEVSISPSYKGGAPGEIMYYTITVANTGSVEDSYVLTVHDNLGWGPGVSPSRLTIPAGENGETELKVRIPADAENCTKDNIIVTATSQVDSTVQGSETCVAHAAILPDVTVFISPSFRDALPGTTASFVVTISNTGNIPDTYQLSTTDNANWWPTISPTSLSIPAGENGLATLSVSIPIAATRSMKDNIRVTATSQTDNRVSDSKTCIAHAMTYITIDNEMIEVESPPIQIPNLKAEVPLTIEVENIDITEMTIRVTNDVSNVRITVQQLKEAGPTGIAVAAPGRLYRWLNIVVENIKDEDVAEVKIVFRVKKSWILEQSVDETTIALYRYDLIAENWEPLPTEKIGENETHILYSATSSKLSIFVITGEVKFPSPIAWIWVVVAAIIVIIAVMFSKHR
jgi:PGF-pre-PGF domain-containing protein